MIDSCYVGDVRDGLRAMIAAGVLAQTCVTSPPYWGLRDYGVVGQLGLEPTIGEYVAGMVEVFREVRRVLRDDATVWLNLGDSYCSTAPGTKAAGPTSRSPKLQQSPRLLLQDAERAKNTRPETPAGLKPKDLCGIPWRVAFALQADGWYLRQDIIWAKPNPMPESVTDRCTKAHEYIFLLSKRERYYYDGDAIAEESAYPGDNRAERTDTRKVADIMCMDNGSRARTGNPTGDTRNKRSVWTVTTQPYSNAHFATFPPKLIEPCILAGSRPSDIVLDPFMGSGTVAQVAQSLGRHWCGCEINPAYHAMIQRRTAQRGMELHA